MSLIESLSKLVNEKLAAKPADINVIGPADNLSPVIQADWLISLLTRMYVSHGITKNPGQVVSSIQSGDCRCWFAVENDHPVACAAQVRQSDDSVEIGRAVSLKSGTGSLVMLSAALDHLLHHETPLVAEVRVSDNFLGVPSGEATQTICFSHLELGSHALVPAFNHGTPVRQEQFLLSSNTMLEAIAPALFPNDYKAEELFLTTAFSLAANGFFSHLTVKFIETSRLLPHWSVQKTAPFAVLTPSAGQTNLETAITEAENYAPFTLIPLETSPTNTGAIIECLNRGFILCGFDRNVAPSGRPVLLLGKLKPDTLLAPIKLAGNFLNPSQKSAIGKIDSAFRKNLKSW